MPVTTPVSALPSDSDAVAEDSQRWMLDQFVRCQRPMLMGFLRRRTRCEVDAEDATQESFVRLMRYVSTQPSSNWKPLLYRIATNVVIDLGRRRDSQPAMHVAVDEMELPSNEPALDERLSREQEMAQLRESILSLPPKCRQVYLLRLEGRSYHAIAAHCGISVKMVEKHIGKALASLRRDVGIHASGSLR